MQLLHNKPETNPASSNSLFHLIIYRRNSAPHGDLMLDLSGLHCPEVVLRVREHAAGMPHGARFEIISTDPLSQIDIPLYARKAGHLVESERAEGGRFHFVLRLAPGEAPRLK